MPYSGSRPIELSSIINVVQHEHDACSRKMELKSVVCLGNNATQKVKRHSKSPKVVESSMEKPILLLPFGHQVSGRASILCYDEATLLKPYVSRELFFYQSIPQELKKFTPQFRGLVMVSFIEDRSTAAVLAYALPRTLMKPNTKNIYKLIGEEPKPHSKRCVKDYGKTHVIYPSKDSSIALNKDEIVENLFVESSEDFSSDATIIKKEKDDVVSELSQGFDMQVCIEDKKPSGKENETFSTTGLHNPWNSKVLDDAWLKLKISDAENPSNAKKKRFTLLENVVARYRHPCVLDLKIGTRVRENASPEKIARHVTAINIGARLSGMQIYHPEQEYFMYHNKYYGHNLTIAGFKSNLRHFFSRGRIPIKGVKKLGSLKINMSSLIDKELVEEAIKKLTELKETIESIQSHRFYSSSVLLLYEGDISSRDEEMNKDEADLSEKIEDFDKLRQSDQELVKESSQLKFSPRSFSFSEFLQRLKHAKLHAKHIHDNSAQHYGEASCDSGRHHTSQKFMKGSVIYKMEKNGVKTSSHKSRKNEHDHKCQRDFGGEDRTKSWPPRSKVSKRPRSEVVRRDFQKITKNHDDLSENSLPRERSLRKHHDAEKIHELQKLYDTKKNIHTNNGKSHEHHGEVGDRKSDSYSIEKKKPVMRHEDEKISRNSHGDHERVKDDRHSRKHDKRNKSHKHDEYSKSQKHDADYSKSPKFHDEYSKSQKHNSESAKHDKNSKSQKHDEDYSKSQKHHDEDYSKSQKHHDEDYSKSQKHHDEDYSKSQKHHDDDDYSKSQKHNSKSGEHEVDSKSQNDDSSGHEQDHEFGKSLRREDLKRRHCDVPCHHNSLEVKMIDFAHYCFHDDIMHPGPDGGFIFGLDNLISLLSDMIK